MQFDLNGVNQYDNSINKIGMKSSISRILVEALSNE